MYTYAYTYRYAKLEQAVEQNFGTQQPNMF